MLTAAEENSNAEEVNEGEEKSETENRLALHKENLEKTRLAKEKAERELKLLEPKIKESQDSIKQAKKVIAYSTFKQLEKHNTTNGELKQKILSLIHEDLRSIDDAWIKKELNKNTPEEIAKREIQAITKICDETDQEQANPLNEPDLT